MLPVAVTGCSASPSSTTATSSPAPSVTAATSTAWTLAQACDYWRTGAGPVVKAYDAMRAARTKQNTGVTSWKTVRDATGPYGSASRTFAGHLLSPPQPFPTPLATSVPPVTSFTLLSAAWAERVSRATTEAGFTTLWADDPGSQALPSDYTEAQTAIDQACPRG